jgi:hypothetical protein
VDFRNVEIPSHGDQKNRVREIVETTAKHFKPGELAPQVGDMNKWQISITNQY